MSRRLVNFLLFLVFLGSLGLHVAIERDNTQRNYEFMPEMVRSAAYSTYSPNPNFPNGETLQLPEFGTIARGRMPLHYRPLPEDATRAGVELTNPYSAKDAHVLERGAFVFANYCQICHGPEGKGDGPVPQRGVPLPPSLLGDKTVQRKDGELFHVLTYGQGNMSAHAVQLSPADRWRVILYVRSLQQKAAGEKRP